jgi:hypothetical protein
MIDLLYIVIIIGFFALMVAFVRFCEHIVGKDEAVDLAYQDSDESGPVADVPSATTPEEVPA